MKRKLKRPIFYLCLLLGLCMTACQEPSTLSPMEKELRISKIIIDYLQMVSVSSVEIKGPMTIEEVERESIEELSKSSRRDIPKVPFGFINDWWNEFKDKYQDGDEIYYFRTDERSWRMLLGTAGYVLIRNENIVDMFWTSMS